MNTKQMILIHAFNCLLIVWGGSPAVSAENWMNWRGPGQQGAASSGDFPTEWGKKKNIAWEVQLPGSAGSTPVVWQDKVVITCPIEGKNGVICFDREGRLLWQTTVGTEAPPKHRKGSGTNPSPVTDGERIFVYFKSGDLGALDWDGKVVWQKNLQKLYGPDTLWWDLGTSPVLTSDHVVVACVQTGPSYVAAFDQKTGELAWKVDRDVPAPEEAAQTYSTPVVTTFQGEEQIVVLGADHVTCYRAKTGEELWRISGMNPEQDKYFRSIASLVIWEGIVIAPYARGQSLTAIKMGGRGDVTDSHILWRKELGSDVPTPAVDDGKVYICGDKGLVSCLEVKSGKQLWSQELPKNRNTYSSSPIIAGDKLYLVREDAVTFVLDTTSQEILAMNEIGDDEYTVSTPVLVDDQLLLRTFDRLICIRNSADAVSMTD